MLVREVTRTCHAEQPKGELEFGGEGAQNPLGALRAAGRETPRGGPADQRRVGSERDRDRDVDTSADAAVDEDRGTTADRLHDPRERQGGRDRAVELATAVVGDDDPGGAVL